MSRTLQTAVNHVSRQKRIICLLVIVSFCLVIIFSSLERASAAGGDLDPSFNPGGGVGADGQVLAVAVQPDGKIIIGGNFFNYNGVFIRGIARLNANGTRDTTFNSGGTGTNNTVRAIAVQPDGKILIGGDFTSYNGSAAANDRILRLNTDGTRDTTFNTGGDGANGSVFAIALQGDDKILIGGTFTSYVDFDDDFASDNIARLLPDGQLDSFFNSAGAGANNSVLAVAVQPNGRILIGGDFTSYNGNAAASDKILRLNTDGTRDTTFNNVGVGASDTVRAIAVQPNGRILIGGDFTSYNGNAAASDRILRLNTDGTRDTTFNTGGVGANDFVDSIAVQADGKIIIGGNFGTYNGDTDSSNGVTRLNSNGTLDTSFNYGSSGANSTVFAIVLQPDGKIIIGGDFTLYNRDDAATSDFIERLRPAPGEIAFSTDSNSVNETAGNAIITLRRTGGTDNKVVGKVTLADVTTTPADYRFTPGALDATFNNGGVGAGGPATPVVNAIAVQADGRILIGGDFTSYNGNAAASDGIMRLNTNGTRDTTFNNGGVGADDEVLAVAVQPDGKILIGGSFFNYNGVFSQGIARLNANGTRDTTFNNGGTGTNNTVRAIAVQPDGKILIGGDFTSYNGNAAASDRIERLNTNGTLDISFHGAGASDTVRAIAVEPGGRILIGGDFTSYNGNAAASDFIMRLIPDGTRDTTFNNGGVGANNFVDSIAVQANGRIIIGGDFGTYNNDTDCNNGVARLNSNGTLDTSFNNGGVGANSTVFAVALQADGKIIIGGDFTLYNRDDAASDHIARLNSNGTLDTTFNPGGVGANGDVNALALQGDGKIIIGGNFTSYNGDAAASNMIARLDGDLFVTWPAGDATDKTILLPIVNDGLNNEANETLNLSLTVVSGGATLGTPSTATLTIRDPNEPPINTVPAAQSTIVNTVLVFSQANGNQISIADLDAGTNPVRVTLTATRGILTLNGITGLTFITGDGTNDATMSFIGTVTAINTALNGLSFNPTAGLSGAASLQIVTNDQGNTGSGGALSDTDTVNITVVGGGTLQLSAATFSVNEGTATATITVTRTGGSSGATSVQFATSNNPPPTGAAGANGSCAQGRDYVTQTSTLSWADNDATNKTFTVAICEDVIFEGNETLNITLSNPTGSASLGTPSQAVLTIVENEPQPTLSINDVTLTEGNTGTKNANFTVTLSVRSSRDVTVSFATANGTAQAGTDYTAAALTTLTFTPGQTSKTVTVQVIGDTVSEPNETFFVNLSNATVATIADSQGQGTITNDD